MQLAKAKMRLEEKSSHLRQLRQELESAEQRQAEQKRTSAWELWLWLKYKDRMQQDVQLAQAKVQEQMQKVQECRDELASRSQELKKMERLKDKQALEHKQWQEHKEQKELDEVAALLYQKRNI